MIGRAIQLYEFIWSLEAHEQQRLAWEDAAQARIARAHAEYRAAAQLEAMLTAHPSGSLGNAKLNDWQALQAAGLLP